MRIHKTTVAQATAHYLSSMFPNVTITDIWLNPHILDLANVLVTEPASSSRPPQLPRHKHSWSRSVLRVLLLVLLCILCTLAVCKLTELRHQPLCISVNTLYEDVVAAVQNHKALQNLLHQNSQQWLSGTGTCFLSISFHHPCSQNSYGIVFWWNCF